MNVQKADEITNPNSCLSKAAPDEPIFVLRAQDVFAASLVREWANRAWKPDGSNSAKIAEARELADWMDKWPKKKVPD